MFDILGVDIWEVDVLGVDILEVDILGDDISGFNIWEEPDETC